MTSSEPEDLLRRAAAGDREAFSQFVVSTRARVFRYARTLARSEADAEDVMQRTFVAAWRSAPTFEGRSTALAWLFTIARHAAIRAGRVPVGAPKTFESIDAPEIEALGCAAGFGDPEALAVEHEQTELLRAALAALDPEDREVLTLRDVEGLSGPEVEAVLGLSRAGMKSRLHRARLRLLSALKETNHER